MTRIHFALIMLGLFINACAESREYRGPEGIAAGRRVAELSDSEWAAFCDWHEDIYLSRYGETHYACEGDEFTYDATATACVMSGRFGITPDCALTVGDYAECLLARADVRCWLGESIAECEIAFCPRRD